MEVKALPHIELPRPTPEEIEAELLPHFQEAFGSAPWVGTIPDWAAKNVVLPASYSPSGPFDISISPYLVEPFKAIQDPNIRQINLMAPPRSGKTLLAEIVLLYLIANCPGNILWIQSTEGASKKMGDTRMSKLLRLCPPVEKLIDKTDRYAVTQKRYKFASGIEVHLVSATLNSLQSSGYKYIVFDEVWLADSGLIAEAQARIGDFQSTYKIILISQGGSPERTDWTMEFLRSPIKEYGYKCPNCKKEQLYYFNQRRSDLTYGGLQWARNATTWPNQIWNPDEAAKTVALECVNADCKGVLIDNAATREYLEASSSYIYTKESGNKDRISFRYNALAVPKFPWSTLCKEYLEAENQANFTGDTSLKEIFEQKRLAESYGSRSTTQNVILRTFDVLPDAETTEKGIPVLTVDIQQKSPRFWWIVRAWQKNGDSWKLGHGSCDSWAEIAAIREKFNVRHHRVLVDSGNNPKEDGVYAECVKAGYLGNPGGQKMWVCYRATKGSGLKAFKHSEKDWRAYSEIEYQKVSLGNDPKYAGNIGCPLIVWSNYRIKSILEHLRDGKGAKWLSNDDDPEYKKQIASEIAIREVKNNKPSYRYVKLNENDPNEYWDLEALQVLAACMSNWLDASPKQTLQLAA